MIKSRREPEISKRQHPAGRSKSEETMQPSDGMSRVRFNLTHNPKTGNEARKQQSKVTDAVASVQAASGRFRTGGIARTVAELSSLERHHAGLEA